MIPKGSIDRPAAAGAYFGERPNLPGPADLSMTPGAIAHKTHQFSIAVFALSVIADAG